MAEPQAFYNENDPHAAQWLRELIKAGQIMPGHVDERSIHDVRASDLAGFTRVHFFAGIGGWDYALQLAGWPDDRPVWTGSAPCQPFSPNGRNKGTEDHRDLWPIFRRLIADAKPAAVFGEQTERAITHGWLDRLCDDLEAEDYAIGSAVLPACGAGATHERSRLWWVADSKHGGLAKRRRASIAVSNCGERERVHGLERSRVPIETRSVVEQWLTPIAPRRDIIPLIISMVDAIPAGLVRRRGYGNAIDPYIAAHFIQAFCEVIDDPAAGYLRKADKRSPSPSVATAAEADAPDTFGKDSHVSAQ